MYNFVGDHKYFGSYSIVRHRVLSVYAGWMEEGRENYVFIQKKFLLRVYSQTMCDNALILLTGSRGEAHSCQKAGRPLSMIYSPDFEK